MRSEQEKEGTSFLSTFFWKLMSTMTTFKMLQTSVKKETVNGTYYLLQDNESEFTPYEFQSVFPQYDVSSVFQLLELLALNGGGSKNRTKMINILKNHCNVSVRSHRFLIASEFIQRNYYAHLLKKSIIQSY